MEGHPGAGVGAPAGAAGPVARGVAWDVHHAVKRSQGSSDFDLDQLVALCRWFHDQTDAPYERGRLVVTALGAGQFMFEVVQRAGRGPTSPVKVCPRGQNRAFDNGRDSSVLE